MERSDFQDDLGALDPGGEGHTKVGVQRLLGRPRHLLELLARRRIRSIFGAEQTSGPHAGNTERNEARQLLRYLGRVVAPAVVLLKEAR